MKVTTDIKNLDNNPVIEGFIQRTANKIQRLLPHFPEDSIHLKITIEHHSNRNHYTASFSLHLPDKILSASQTSEENPRTAILSCRDDIIRQIKRFKAELRKEKQLRKEQKNGHWKRTALT